MVMKEDKKKKKFKLRNPFKKKSERKTRSETTAKSNEGESPSKTPPNTPVRDDNAYEAPSPHHHFVTGSPTESQEEENSSQNGVPHTEVACVEDVETNEGWAEFEARPVDQLPQPFPRSRRQLVKLGLHIGGKSDTDKSASNETSVSFDVKAFENAIEVSTSKRERSDSSELDQKKPDEATEDTTAEEPVSVESDKGSVSAGSSNPEAEQEIAASPDKSHRVSDFDQQDRPELVSQNNQEKTKDLEPCMSDDRSQSPKQADNAVSETFSALESDNAVWSQFGLSATDSLEVFEPFKDFDSSDIKNASKTNSETKIKLDSESAKLEGIDQRQNERKTPEMPNTISPPRSCTAKKQLVRNKQIESKVQVDNQEEPSETIEPMERKPVVNQTTKQGADRLQNSETIPVVASSIPLMTSSSMMTQKMGTKKVFAESMRDSAAHLDDKDIQEALYNIDEQLHEREFVSFSDSFIDTLEDDSESLSEATPVERVNTVRFVPTMGNSGETELVAVYENMEDTPHEKLDEKENQEDTNNDEKDDEALLPNPFLSGFWQEADPPSVNDDHTVSTLAGDYTSVNDFSEKTNLVTGKTDENERTMVATNFTSETSAYLYEADTDLTVGSAVDSFMADTGASTSYGTYDSRDYTADSRRYQNGKQSTSSMRKAEKYRDDDDDDDYTYLSRETGVTFETNDVTYGSRDTGITGYASTVGTWETGYTGLSSVATAGDAAHTEQQSRQQKKSSKTSTQAKENLSPSSSRRRRSGSFTEDDYDDNETIGTEYTNNYQEPSTLDELADMAAELRQSGPGVIIKWLS